jgi:hypothetical protein
LDDIEESGAQLGPQAFALVHHLAGQIFLQQRLAFR